KYKGMRPAREGYLCPAPNPNHRKSKSFKCGCPEGSPVYPSYPVYRYQAHRFQSDPRYLHAGKRIPVGRDHHRINIIKAVAIIIVRPSGYDNIDRAIGCRFYTTDNSHLRIIIGSIERRRTFRGPFYDILRLSIITYPPT